MTTLRQTRLAPVAVNLLFLPVSMTIMSLLNKRIANIFVVWATFYFKTTNKIRESRMSVSKSKCLQPQSFIRRLISYLQLNESVQ